MIQHEKKQADKTDVGENAKRYNKFWKLQAGKKN